MQLLHNSAPVSSVLLTALVLLFEPTGLTTPLPLFGAEAGPPSEGPTLLGFPYTRAAVAAIAVSALLGLAVSLSTFLVIGATSSLTYNVVGHIKSVIIIFGGVVIFGESLPTKKVLALKCRIPFVAMKASFPGL
jgi:solute carrier family 35 protein E3